MVEANGLAEALAGRPLAGAYAATVVGIFRIRQPDGKPVVLPELPAMRALTGEEVTDYPVAITAADGQSRLVLVSAFPIQEGECVVGALSIWYEVSTREAVSGEGSTFDFTKPAV